MTFEQLLAAAIGAFFGAAGWLIVGLYMARRASRNQARNAARAVYFELAMNAIDIKVAAEKRAAIFEALSLINEQLWLGHFEMWSGSGLVVFRHSTILDTREDEGLSLEQAEAIVEAAVEECERFYPVFQFVLWGGKSPGEAISAALIETAGEA